MSTHQALKALNLDEFQSAAAYTDKTAVVTAGAGAGKTRALVGRYLYILLEKNRSPEHVLALTFTRKAAAEMFQRAHEALTSPEISKPELAERLSHAHIQTLDSFCREIVAGAARQYGFTPEFQIDEPACASLAKKTAYRYVLAHERAPGLKPMLSAFGYERVVNNLFASFGADRVEQPWLGNHICRNAANLGEEEFQRVAAVIANEFGAIASDILRLAESPSRPSFKDGTKQAIRAALAFPVSENERPLEALGAFKAYLDDPAHSIDLRSVGKNDVEASIKECAARLRDKKQLQKISQILDFERFLPEYRAIMERLDEYSDMLCEEKQRANLLNYRDLGAMAVHILERDADIRRFWESRFDYILIDEFQDNNELQKKLLLLLSQKEKETRGEKLFFVGDEKQSIYLFRGADVSVFKALAPELGAARYSLLKNYRSSPKLIEFFNAAFSYIMKPPVSERKSFEAEYKAMESARDADFPSNIEFHGISVDRAPYETRAPHAKTTLLSSKESMAYRLAIWIKNAVESDSAYRVLDQKGAQRQAVYPDIAVLMRSASRQYELEKYLRIFGIPYVSDTSSSIFSEEPVNDLYYFLRLLMDPDDLFATAAVVRSPLCRLSDDGYVSILTEKKGLRALIEDAPAFENPDDKNAFGTLVSFYDSLRSQVDHITLMELCAAVWKKGGLEASISGVPSKAPYLEHWNAIRSIAAEVEANGGHLAAFLSVIRAYTRNERIFDANQVPRQDVDGVRLMTIHKAKGLEFPIVIIPWIEMGTGKNSNDDLWGELETFDGVEKRSFFTADIGFPDRIESGSNVLQTYARELRVQKEHAEIKRLFYVACTRAIDHLILFEAQGMRAASVDSFHSLLFQESEKRNSPPDEAKLAELPYLGMLKYQYEPRATEGEIEEARALWAKKLSAPTEIPQSRSAPKTRATLSPESPEKASQRFRRITATAMNAANARELALNIVREPIFTPWKGTEKEPESFEPTAYGTLVHELFARLASGQSEDIETSLPPSALARAKAQLAPLMESRFFSEMFAAGFDSASSSPKAVVRFEFPFLLGLDRCLIEGRMDVIAETSDDVVVLDLKTDQRFVPHEYSLQLALYHLAAQELFEGKRVRSGLIYLSYGEIAWLEGTIDKNALLSISRAISYNNP